MAILVCAILYLLISGNFFSPSPVVILCQLLALGLSVWARQSFQSGQFSIHATPSKGPLLQTGPYKLIRHPMYAAALLLIWSSVFGHLSLITAIVGFTMTCVTAIRILIEDQLLLIEFPEYAEYTRTTKRVIPYVI